MATTDSDLIWKPIQPEGTAQSLLITTCIFSILIIIILPLRFYIRISTRALGFEDWLMFAAFLDVLLQNAWIIYGTVTGIGSPDTKINPAQLEQCAMVVVFWQMTYVTSTALIKCSILWTLIRIATQRRLLWPLYALFAVSGVVGFVSFFVALFRCDPVDAAWTGRGTCLPQTVIIGFSYGISSLNIVIDFSTVIIPVFLVRNMHMKRRLKQVTCLVLGLGFLASIATIIRMPYCDAYSLTTNQMLRMGDLLLWTNFECGLGIIAGSLPMLRKLVKSLGAGTSSSSNGHGVGHGSSYQRPVALVTIGGGGRGPSSSSSKGAQHHRHGYGYSAQVTAIAGERNHQKRVEDCSDGDSGYLGDGGDGESTRKMIRVTQRVECEVTVVGDKR